MQDRCQDADRNCPVCHGKCVNQATDTLARVDMQDESGTRFCEDCTEDAMNSGVFTYKAFRDDED